MGRSHPLAVCGLQEVKASLFTVLLMFKTILLLCFYLTKLFFSCAPQHVKQAPADMHILYIQLSPGMLVAHKKTCILKQNKGLFCPEAGNAQTQAGGCFPGTLVYRANVFGH